jgi:hypothetical protein
MTSNPCLNNLKFVSSKTVTTMKYICDCCDKIFLYNCEIHGMDLFGLKLPEFPKHECQKNVQHDHDS